MKKYIINYILVCLVILIVTSLVYIINNDIEEYVVGDNNTGVIQANINDSINAVVSEVENNRINEADDIYSTYWNFIKNENLSGVTTLNGCGSRFSSFMYDIKDKVDEEIEDLDLCKDFTDNDYATLDLTDSGRNARIKATCIKNAVSNNQKGLNQLMSEYKLKTTPLGRCGYLSENGY